MPLTICLDGTKAAVFVQQTLDSYGLKKGQVLGNNAFDIHLPENGKYITLVRRGPTMERFYDVLDQDLNNIGAGHIYTLRDNSGCVVGTIYEASGKVFVCVDEVHRDDKWVFDIEADASWVDENWPEPPLPKPTEQDIDELVKKVFGEHD